MGAAPFLLILVVIGSLFSTAKFTEEEDAANANRNRRIIGGTVASGKEFPFVAMVEAKDDKGKWYECSATVISKKHVLTAAHCVINIHQVDKIILVIRREPRLKINANFSNDIRDFITAEVKKVIPHPDFNMRELSNDVAVLEAEEAFIAQVVPVPVALDFADSQGQSVTILGFGDYNPEGQPLDLDKLQTSEKLRQLKTYIHSAEHCKDAWPDAQKDMHICVGSRTEGIAIGDSGGPLLVKNPEGRWIQIGVASFGPRRKYHGKPYGFMKTSYYCPWLAKTTNNEFQCEPFSRQPNTTTPQPSSMPPKPPSDFIFKVAETTTTSDSPLTTLSLPILALTIYTSTKLLSQYQLA
uniref:Peptidase S1 domain-containing protein n=2 Tax=Panagrellus redivivus TaxID=6233 RepID=A0A7E4VMQ9_PANRE